MEVGTLKRKSELRRNSERTPSEARKNHDKTRRGVGCSDPIRRNGGRKCFPIEREFLQKNPQKETELKPRKVELSRVK